MRKLNEFFIVAEEDRDYDGHITDYIFFYGNMAMIIIVAMFTLIYLGGN